jgi:REP element-mobilizing transposase RayT
MQLNTVGQVVEACWLELPQRIPGIAIDSFVVMPNHTHGIVAILPEGVGPVGAIHESPLQHRNAGEIENPKRRRSGMVLPKVVGFLKMNTAKRLNQIRGTPGAAVWQRNYYEHVIRDASDLNRIRDYIQSNPSHWLEDEENLFRIR